MANTPESHPDSKRHLELSSLLLSQGDFTGSRNHALLSRKYDPNIDGVDEILAIVDVLVSDHSDWYSILQVHRSDSENDRLIGAQFKKLLTLLNPRTNLFSFSDTSFNLVRQAWSFLSDPLKKTQCDSEIEKNNLNWSSIAEPDQKPVQSFWTVCPYCFNLYEYEKVYEDCCLRCQNCRKAFHGVAIKGMPPPIVVVDGKEGYNCHLGVFKLDYMQKAEEVGLNGRTDFGIYDDEEKTGEEKQGRVEKMVKKNVKTVARNTKKKWGRGFMRNKKSEEEKKVNDMGTGEVRESEEIKGEKDSVRSHEVGELKFYGGEDDVYIDLSDVDTLV